MTTGTAPTSTNISREQSSQAESQQPALTEDVARTIVFGFTRDVQKQHTSIRIPIDIIKLCLTYYYHRGLWLFLLTGATSYSGQSEHTDCYSLQCINMQTAENVELLVYELAEDTNTNTNTNTNPCAHLTLMTKSMAWDTFDGGIASVENLQLSEILSTDLMAAYAPQIRSLFRLKHGHNNDNNQSFVGNQRFNAIFKCGGEFIARELSGVKCTNCHVIIFDANELNLNISKNKSKSKSKSNHNNNDNEVLNDTDPETNVRRELRTINALAIKLPDLPIGDKCKCVYSQKQGLVYVPAATTNANTTDSPFLVFCLAFSDDRKELRWEGKRVQTHTHTATAPTTPTASTTTATPAANVITAARGRDLASVLAIQNGEQLLMIGQTSEKRNFTFDVENGAVQSVADSSFVKARSSTGAVFDPVRNRVYTCSGQSVEYLDIAANEWHRLPSANPSQSPIPCLWIENQTLFACPCSAEFGKQIAFLDLGRGACAPTTTTKTEAVAVHTNATESVIAVTVFPPPSKQQWNTVDNSVDFEMKNGMELERIFCFPTL